jgi:uncharacterized protein (TIGR03083 family)
VSDPLCTHVVRTLVDTWRAISRVCAGLDSASWQSPTDLPGWRVQDVLAHLVGTERFLEGLEPAPASKRTFAYVRNPIGELNENEVDLRRARPGARVFAEWEDLRRRRERTLADADAAYFARPMLTPVGPGTMGDFLGIRILDCWLHQQDLRRALDRPGGLDGPAAQHTIDRLIRSVPMVVGKRAGCPEGATVTVHIHGPVSRTIHCEVRDGRATIVDEPRTPPLATVSLSTEAFVILSAGRRRADDMIAGVLVTADDPSGNVVGRAVVEHLDVMM